MYTIVIRVSIDSMDEGGEGRGRMLYMQGKKLKYMGKIEEVA